jgi:hypothetical protein
MARKPTFPRGTIVELQGKGTEDASYVWTLDDAPDGGEDALQPSDGRRALLTLDVLGDYTVCNQSADATASICCAVHAVDDLRVEELTPEKLSRISGILSIGSTTSADDAEVDGHFDLGCR